MLRHTGKDVKISLTLFCEDRNQDIPKIKL